MKTVSFYLPTPGDTVKVGRILGACLTAPLMIGLIGDLGAGKTTLAQGLAQGLGVAETENVVSPTFTLANEYQGKSGPIFHLDIYRLTLSEFQDAGLDDYLNQRGMARKAITLVEWSNMWPGSYWPPKRLEIILSRDENREGRYLVLTAPEPVAYDIFELLEVEIGKGLAE